MLVTTLSTPIRFAAMKVSPSAEHPGEAERRPGGRSGRAPRACGAGSSDGSRCAGTSGEPSSGTQAGAARDRVQLASRAPARARSPARRPPRPARRPAAMRSAAPRRAPPRPSRSSRSRLLAQRLQLLGQPLGVGGRHEDAVDTVADDVRVAGDVGGDHRRAGRERLGQDHAEALARRATGRRADRPRASRRQSSSSGTRPERLDQALDLGVGEVAARSRHRSAPTTVSVARLVLDQRLERGEQHRQPLALLGSAHEQHPQLVGRGLRRRPAAPRCRRRWGSPCSCPRTSAARSRPQPRRRRSARAIWLKLRRAPASDRRS